MALPYETATSGERAIAEMQKVLRAFGCASFGHMLDYEKGELLVQFKYRDMPVSVRASFQGYAAAWLRHNPYTHRMRHTRSEHERRAREIGSVAVYSVLRDWIKGQVTAVETGILSFEGAFLGQILLPSGRTVLEEAQAAKMLPAPERPSGNVVELAKA
jgi:hypothetical protein